MTGWFWRTNGGGSGNPVRLCGWWYQIVKSGIASTYATHLREPNQLFG